MPVEVGMALWGITIQVQPKITIVRHVDLKILPAQRFVMYVALHFRLLLQCGRQERFQSRTSYAQTADISTLSATHFVASVEGSL